MLSTHLSPIFIESIDLHLIINFVSNKKRNLKLIIFSIKILHMTFLLIAKELLLFTPKIDYPFSMRDNLA